MKPPVWDHLVYMAGALLRYTFMLSLVGNVIHSKQTEG